MSFDALLKEGILENTYRQMINDVPVAVCYLRGADFVIEYANARVARMWGIDPEQIPGKKLFDLRPGAREIGFDQILTRVYESGEPFKAESMNSVIERNGIKEDIFYNYLAIPFRNAKGEIEGLFTYAHEVTEEVKNKRQVLETVREKEAARQHLESLNEEFKFVMDFMPQMLWATRSDGYSFYYNRQWTDYTGLSLDENIGFGWTQTLHPDDYERTVAVWKEAVSSGSLYEIEYRIRRHDGVYRWFLGRGQPLKDAAGNVLKWYGSSTDINEQKQALQDKDEFLGIVSHELKTPVTSLKAFCEYQAERLNQKGDRESARMMGKMEAQVDKLTKLIADLLDVTRLEAGKLSFGVEPLSLVELVAEISEDLQRTTSRHHILAELPENSEPFDVLGDRDRIGQVIINLIGNAIKYSPEAGQITVRLVSRENEIICSVTDHGIGIDPERQSQVFDRYFRVSDGKMNSYPGLGLGLFISAEIIQRHGGEIWLESKPGKGSVFSFSLPALRRAEKMG